MSSMFNDDVVYIISLHRMWIEVNGLEIMNGFISV